MGIAHRDEQMVQVGLVGMEGRGAAQDAHAHDTHGVEHGNGHDGQGEGYQAEAPRVVVDAVGLALEDVEHEDAHNNADDEGAAIADKHLTGATKDIVEEEGQQRGHTYGGEHDHVDIASQVEEETEDAAGHDTVATAVAIDTVDEVDGIDDPDHGEDGEGYAEVGGQVVDAPQTMKVIDAIATGGDEHEHQEDLDKETRAGGELDDIIDGAHIQHHQHGEHDGEQSAAVVKHAADAQGYQDAKHDCNTTQYRDGNTLQLAGIGIVNYVFQQGYAQHLGIDPNGGKQRYHKGYENVKNNGHIS